VVTLMITAQNGPIGLVHSVVTAIQCHTGCIAVAFPSHTYPIYNMTDEQNNAD
jgi:hypothetical protein